MNRNIKFNDIENKMVIRKHYDNKSSFNKIEPPYLMTAHIRENISDFASLIANKRMTIRERNKDYLFRIV